MLKLVKLAKQEGMFITVRAARTYSTSNQSAGLGEAHLPQSIC